MKNCSTEGCERRHYARGMCQPCYLVWYRRKRYGTKRRTFAERFWSKVNRLGGEDCWEWLASKQNRGYGQVARAGTMVLAHRVAYELAVGSIPEGHVIDHLCRNKPCCNPAHLEAVRQRINVQRGPGNATKTTCKHGHEFTPENTYREPSGARRCRACRQEAEQRRGPRSHH